MSTYRLGLDPAASADLSTELIAALGRRAADTSDISMLALWRTSADSGPRREYLVLQGSSQEAALSLVEGSGLHADSVEEMADWTDRAPEYPYFPEGEKYCFSCNDWHSTGRCPRAL
jgi:hypothetical protein